MTEIRQPQDDLANNAKDLKTRLLSLTQAEFKALQNAYHYFWITNLLRSTGWVNVLLGSVTLWFGLSDVNLSVLKIFQALFGAVIVGQSLWTIVAPTTNGVFRYSVLFLVAGSWNILIAVVGSVNELALLWGMLGLLQLWWAYQYYMTYQKYIQLSISKPVPEVSNLYHELWGDISKAEDGNYDLITLQIGRRWWKGLLLNDLAVFAHSKQKAVILAYESEVIFTPLNSTAASKNRVKGSIKFDTIASRAIIQRSFFEKYIQWKSLDDTKRQQWLSQLDEVAKKRRLPKFIRIPLVIIGIIMLLYLVFIISGMVTLILKYR